MTFASRVDGELIIPAPWQAAWADMFDVAQILGADVIGFVQDSWGQRTGFFRSTIPMAVGIAVAYISSTPAQFLGARIIKGFAVGGMNATTQTYVSEIAPLPMRSIALSMNMLIMVSLAPTGDNVLPREGVQY